MFDKLSLQPHPNCIHNYITVQLDKRGSLPGSVVVVCVCVLCFAVSNPQKQKVGILWVPASGSQSNGRGLWWSVIRRKGWTGRITNTVSFLTRSSDLFHSGTNGCDLETTAPQEQGKRLKNRQWSIGLLCWPPAGSFDLFSGFL